MSDTLRALLCDKYEATIEKVTDAIAGFNDYLGCGCCTAYGYDESVARTGEDERPRMAAHDALARVLPELLAAAWDEGKHSEHTPACRLGDGNCTCPNPYRTEGEPSR